MYCMQVSWFWIKQRPHFIAEGLADDYRITVIDRKEFKKSVLNPTSIKIYHRFRLPFERISVIKSINKVLYRIQYNIIAKFNDIIWITSPIQYELLGECKGKKVVYDCMDDMPALASSLRERAERERFERKLLQRADVVFASSEHLRKHLIEKYGPRDITVVNNAIKNDISTYKSIPFESSGIEMPKGKTIISYIGTISGWFDFDLLINYLNKNPKVELCLFGPRDCSVPSHKQIRYYGPIEHKFVLGLMERSDILIMPFVVNDLIRSVNPVKLYEYIYSGKPCVAPLYEESKPFSNFVNLYSDQEGFEKIISSIINGEIKQQAKDKCEEFAMRNTWSSRVLTIKKQL